MAVKINGSLSFNSTFNKPETTYQQNLAQPVEQKWYQGDQPTMRETLGQILRVYQADRDTGLQLQNDFFTQMQDTSSMFWAPYTQATNKAVSNLQTLGFDMNNLNDDWINANSGWIYDNLILSDTTNSPTKPGKKASWDQNVAYELFQYSNAGDMTRKAKQEWQALQEEATYWAKRKDMNFSDDAIVNRIYGPNFAKKYPTLYAMDQSISDVDKPLLKMNEGIDYSLDAVYGTIWAARNDGGVGNVYENMALSALGIGNQWKDNPDISARLDKGNKNTYAPYSVSSTLYDACLYFNTDHFDRKWLEDNYKQTDDATYVKYYNMVADAIDFTEQAQAEAQRAKDWLAKRLPTAEDPAELLQKFQNNLDRGTWGSLKRLDDSTKKISVNDENLIPTTDRIDFSMYDVKNMIWDACAKNNELLDINDTSAKNGFVMGTDQSVAATRAGDRKIKDAGANLEGVITPAEENAFLNAGSTEWSKAIYAMRGLKGQFQDLLINNEGTTTTNYGNRMATVVADLTSYNDAKKDYDSIMQANDDILNRIQKFHDAWANRNDHHRDFTQEEHEVNELIRRLSNEDGMGIDINDFGALHSKVTGRQLAEGQNPIEAAGVLYDYIYGTKDAAEANGEEMWFLGNKLREDRDKAKAEMDRTAYAQKTYDNEMAAWDTMIAAYDNTGMDSTGLRTAKEVLDVLPFFSTNNFAEYDLYDTYDIMAQAVAKGQSFDEVWKDAKDALPQMEKALENSKWIRQYLDDNGIEIPQEYRDHLESYISKLERFKTDYDYFSLQGEKDFDELAKKGEEIEKNSIIPGYWLRNTSEQYMDEYGARDDRYMTEAEKKTYYYLLGKYGAEDPQAGYRKATEYWDYMNDPNNGVMGKRTIEQWQQYATDLVASHPVLANVISALAAPVEGLTGLIYMVDGAFNGYSDTNPLLALGKFSETVNQQTMERIVAAVPEGLARDFATSLYEIGYNQGRSLANGFVMGGISIGGKLGGIISEIVGAAPMALGAAAMAVADAKEKGLEDGDAIKIGLTTLVMESFSEGITLSNIKGVFSGAEGAAHSIGELVKNWLTEDGFQEAFGETITSWVENEVDKAVAGNKSEHDQKVLKYIEDHHLDPENKLDQEEAEAHVYQEEVQGYLHTALISYLSPGVNVALKTVSQSWNDFKNVIAYATNEQRHGNPITLTESIQKYNEWKAGAQKEARVNDAQPAQDQTQQEQTAQPEQQAQQEQAQQEQVQPEQPSALPQQRKASASDETFLSDLSALLAVPNSTPEAQTAAIGSLFGGDENTPSGDTAQAAAANITNVFGDTGGAVQGLYNLLSAAHRNVMTTLEGVKSAVMTAAMSESSAAAQTIQSEEYQNATPEQQAEMLEATVQQDAQNQTVQDEVAKTVYENRVAEKEKPYIAAKEVEEGSKQAAARQADKAEADAWAKVEQARIKFDNAEKALPEKWNISAMKGEAVRQFAAEMVNGGGVTDMNNKIMSNLTNEANAARIVAEQAEAEYQNAQNELQKAQEEAQKASKAAEQANQDAMDEVRAKAEADVQAEDQQRAEIAAQQAEQERIAAEQAAQEQAQRDIESGKAEEDHRNMLIEQIADNEHLEGEERENRIKELKEQAEKVKIKITDLNKPMNNTEGFLAVNAFSRKIGLPIELADLGPVDSKRITRGKYVYDKATGQAKIVLNQNLIKAGKMTVGQALVEASLHEIVHSMRNTNSYNAFRKVVMQSVFADAGSSDAVNLYNENARFRAKVDMLIQERVNAGDENFVGKDKPAQIEAAEDEIVADFARLNLAEKDVVERFMDAGMGGRIRNTLHNINQALKNYFGNLTGEERKTAEYLRRAERAFQKAMVESAKSDVHPNSESFSVSQMAESMNLGMVVNDDTLQLYMPDPNGNIIGDGKNGTVKGQRYVKIDGVTEGRKITPDMIVNTPVGMLIDMGLSDEEFTGNDGNVHTQKGDARQMFADLMNLCARYKDNNLIWEIAGSEFSENFSALKSNSDPQYKNTVDFGTICSKTQGIVDVLSQTMIDRVNAIRKWNEEHAAEIAAGTAEEKVFTGLNREDIMEVYNITHNSGLSVPCPVCYVFSRWMGVPGMLGQMNRFQHEYVETVKDVNGKTVYDKNGDAVIDWKKTSQKANEYLQHMVKQYSGIDIFSPDLTTEERQNAISAAKEKIAKEKNSINGKIRSRAKSRPNLYTQLGVLQEKLDKTDMTPAQRRKVEEQITKKEAAIKKNERESDQFMDDLKEFEAFNWVSQVLCLQHTEGRSSINDLNEDGSFVMDEKGFRLTPEEILFDLNRSGEFAGYAKNWRYRTTRGAGMGKAIMPYSGASIGDIMHGEAIRWKQSENPLLQMDRAAAETAYKSAKRRVRQQNLVGGQRFQSTSDFRPEWGLDYIMSFLEMQALGSKVQMYTKVAEAVDFLGSIGADVNLSIMAKNNGYHVATDEEIKLAETDTDEGRDLKSRMGMAKDENGNAHLYVMDFSDVTGMDYNTAKGKTKKFNNVQMILVGMNDVHIRLAMGNEDIDFIIPWHSSGNSKDVLQQLVASVGEALEESSDYTDSQTDQIKSHKEGKGKKEKTIDDRSEMEIARWNARIKILTGVANKDVNTEKPNEGGFGTITFADGTTMSERELVYTDPWLSQLYSRFYEEGVDADCFGVALTKDQAEQIFPYEYWDKNSTRENADVNGQRFAEYCDRLGLVPRFSQFKDDPGYWKLLIDRKMYDNNTYNPDGTVKEYGKYREQKVVDVTNARIENDPNDTLDEVTDRKKQVYQLPESTTAKYGRKHFAQETEAAIKTAGEYLSQKYDVTEQRSDFGDLTEADRDLMTQEEFNDTFDETFDRMIENLSVEELEDLLQEFIGPSFGTTPTKPRAEETTDTDAAQTISDLNDMYTEAVDRGDYGTARRIVDKVAEKAGYTVRGTHRTNGEFTVFDKTMQTGKNGKTLGNGFYIAAGEGTEYDSDIYGKNRMLVYANPGRVFDIQKDEFTEKQANDVYDKYFAPHHSSSANDEDSPYRIHVIGKLQNSYRLMDYIKEAADTNDTTTDEIFKWLGYDSIKDGPQYAIFDSEQIKLADPITYDDNGNAIPLSERFNASNPDIRYSDTGELSDADRDLISNEQQLNKTLVETGVLTQNEVDRYNGNLPGMPLAEGGAQRQFGHQTAHESDALHQEVKDYLYTHSDYTPDSNQAQIDRSIAWVQSHANANDPDGYRGAVDEVTRDDFDYRSADGQARMLTVMSMAALMGDLETERRIADAYNRQGTDLGRQLQARKIFRLMTPLGRRMSLEQEVARINQENRNHGSDTEVGLSEWVLKAAESAETEEDYENVRKAAEKELAEQIPANWKEKLRTWRMLSMLANPRTHIRNIVGNAIFKPVVGLKNAIGAGLESQFIKDGQERTKAIRYTDDAKSFAAQDAIAMKDMLTGEAKYSPENRIEREKKAFGQKNGLLSRTVGKAVQGIADFNSWALEAEDWIFLNKHYQNAMASYMTANNLTSADMTGKTLESARNYAVLEAQKATYRDANAVSDWLNKASKNGGIMGFLVDTVLPFKKTPANILRRGIEYSPVGLIRSFATAKKGLDLYAAWEANGFKGTMPKGAKSMNQVLDGIASGLTGTAIAALGALGYALGAVKLGFGDDDDDELEKLRGGQAYSIELFGHSFTADWAAPVCMPFFTGAALWKNLTDENEDADLGMFVESLLNISEPVFNLSMLDGVSSLLDSLKYAGNAGQSILVLGEKIGANYVGSFVPSALGAVARTVDTTRRKTFVESGKPFSSWYAMVEQAQNKIPGLSMNNIPYRNVWGEPEVSNRVEAFLENFLLPGYHNAMSDEKLTDELQRIFDQTGDKSVIPSAAKKTVGNIKLTDQEYDQYAVTRGQLAKQLLNELIERPEFIALTPTDISEGNPEAQAALIGEVWKYVNAVARHEIDPDYDIKSQGAWIAGAYARGDAVETIFANEEAKAKEEAAKAARVNLVTAINKNNAEAIDVCVEDLKRAGVTTDKIKGYLYDDFRDAYKAAYLADDDDTMQLIEDALMYIDLGEDSIKYDIFKRWMKDAEKSRE